MLLQKKKIQFNLIFQFNFTRLNKLGIDPKNFPTAEIVLQRLCLLWTNFAKYGDPTPCETQPILNCSEWKPIDKEAFISNHELNYLKIDNDKCKMERNPDNDRFNFWRQIFSDIGHFKANL